MRRHAAHRGAELVEFALVVPALLLIFGGIAEFGYLFRTFEVTTNAAREGARLGAIPGHETNDYATVRAIVDEYLTNSGLRDSTCDDTGGPCAVTTVTQESVALPDGLSAVGVRVSVTYTYRTMFLGPIVGLMNGTFTDAITYRSTALMRVQVAATGP